MRKKLKYIEFKLIGIQYIFLTDLCILGYQGYWVDRNICILSHIKVTKIILQF